MSNGMILLTKRKQVQSMDSSVYCLIIIWFAIHVDDYYGKNVTVLDVYGYVTDQRKNASVARMEVYIKDILSAWG